MDGNNTLLHQKRSDSVVVKPAGVGVPPVSRPGTHVDNREEQLYNIYYHETKVIKSGSTAGHKLDSSFDLRYVGAHHSLLLDKSKTKLLY